MLARGGKVSDASLQHNGNACLGECSFFFFDLLLDLTGMVLVFQASDFFGFLVFKLVLLEVLPGNGQILHLEQFISFFLGFLG